jgi:transcriptional regulator with XRE-family HTH domain
MSEFEHKTREMLAVELLKYQQREHIALKELSQRLQVSPSQLRRYINKRANMSMSVFCRISQLVGLTITKEES